MNKYAQIFTGGTGKSKLAWETVEASLPHKGLDGIIIGWGENPELYRSCRRYTRERGIKLYFWLPVFSEMSSAGRQSAFVLYSGKAAKPVRFTSQESFDFCCVSNTQNAVNVAEYFNSHFLEFGFDGVFLDRIRYPSFTAGIDAMLGCWCPSCQDFYEQNGALSDMQAVAAYLKVRIADENCINPLGLKSYNGGEWSFDDDRIAGLFRAKQEIISLRVGALIEMLRGSVKEIGLDLFAPFMSTFVGQPYKELSQAADFIKPMLYRHTDTPAGFGFELKQMINAVSAKENREARGKYIKSLLEIGDDGDTEKLMKKELCFLSSLDVPVLAGIELHTAPDCIPVTAKNIADNLTLIGQSGLSGVTACWNLLDADEKNRNTFFG